MDALDTEILWEAGDAVLVGGAFERLPADAAGDARAILRARSDRLLTAARARLALPEVAVPRGPGGAPVWPAGQRGSFSHWRNRSACLLRRGQVVDPGVDLEGFADDEARLAIRDEVLGPAERDRLDRARLDDGIAEALAFSAKESFFKAAYPRLGRMLDFDAAEIVALDAERGLILRLPRALGPGLGAGARIPVACRLFADRVLTWVLLPADGAPPLG